MLTEPWIRYGAINPNCDISWAKGISNKHNLFSKNKPNSEAVFFEPMVDVRVKCAEPAMSYQRIFYNINTISVNTFKHVVSGKERVIILIQPGASGVSYSWVAEASKRLVSEVRSWTTKECNSLYVWDTYNDVIALCVPAKYSEYYERILNKAFSIEAEKYTAMYRGTKKGKEFYEIAMHYGKKCSNINFVGAAYAAAP